MFISTVPFYGLLRPEHPFRLAVEEHRPKAAADIMIAAWEGASSADRRHWQFCFLLWARALNCAERLSGVRDAGAKAEAAWQEHRERPGV